MWGSRHNSLPRRGLFTDSTTKNCSNHKKIVLLPKLSGGLDEENNKNLKRLPPPLCLEARGRVPWCLVRELVRLWVVWQIKIKISRISFWGRHHHQISPQLVRPSSLIPQHISYSSSLFQSISISIYRVSNIWVLLNWTFADRKKIFVPKAAGLVPTFNSRKKHRNSWIWLFWTADAWQRP